MDPLNGCERENVKNDTRALKNTMPLIKRWVILIAYSCIILFTLSIVRMVRDVTVDYLGPRGFTWIIWSLFALCGIFLGIWLIRKTIYRSPTRLLIILCTAGAYVFTISRLELAVERLHYIEYGIVAILALRVFMLSHQNAGAVILSLLYVFDLGLLDEFIQWILPMRVGEFRDVGINLTAGLFALIPAVACNMQFLPFRLPGRKSFATILFHSTCTLIFWGMFIIFVHGFGHEITLNSGSRFKSVFKELDFGDISRAPGAHTWRDVSRSSLASRSDAGIVQWFGESLMQWRAYRHPTPEAYNYEAWRHVRHRDGLANKRYRKFREAHEEERILRRFYRSYLDQFDLSLSDSTYERYGNAAPREPVPYMSPVQELLITDLSGSQFAMIIAVCSIILGISGILLNRVRH